jgi:prepilin-type N-terminal cleavage/methylation domain-containing protein
VRCTYGADVQLSALTKGDSRRSVKSRGTIQPKSESSGERGFSLIELLVVAVIIIVIAAMALPQFLPTLAASRADAAMREVVDQVRQAREYAVENRRYVQITFSSTNSVPQVVITQLNSKTANAGADAVLSTVTLQYPLTYCVCSMPDTPDAFGNGGAVYFESLNNGPTGGMVFQSDGELLDGTTYQPINGTVFLGVTGKPSVSRAVTVLGATGRVRAYRSTGSAWFSF